MAAPLEEATVERVTLPSASRLVARRGKAQKTRNKDLAKTSHDLRQPLQTLMLLHALLAKTVEGAPVQKLLKRMGVALDSLTSIISGLSDPKPTPNVMVELQARQSVSAAEDPIDTSSALSKVTPGAGMLAPVIFMVDDDCEVRAAIRSVLEDNGNLVAEFSSCEEFLAHDRGDRDGCLLIDAYLPAMSGLELLRRLQAKGCTLPAIMITGNSDVPMAVNAMKAGAIDFIEKPIGRLELLASIERAVDLSQDQSKRLAWQRDAARQVASLTARQREVMDLVLAGSPSKNIAADLGISQRTVENHRAAIMARTSTKSLPELARLVVVAATMTSEQLTAAP